MEPPTQTAGTSAMDAAWTEVGDLVLPELKALVDALRARTPPVPVPEVLYEVASPDGLVHGTLELAWPDIRRGVVIDPALADAFPGWDVVVYTGHEDVLADGMGVAA